jgi:iron(III) transport system ATP-binding protein
MGLIAQRGTPQELYESPARPSSWRASWAKRMLFPAERRRGTALVTLGPLRIDAAPAWSPAGPVKVAVRPEAWHVGPPGAGLNARLAKLGLPGQQLRIHL